MLACLAYAVYRRSRDDFVISAMAIVVAVTGIVFFRETLQVAPLASAPTSVRPGPIFLVFVMSSTAALMGWWSVLGCGRVGHRLMHILGTATLLVLLARGLDYQPLLYLVSTYN